MCVFDCLCVVCLIVDVTDLLACAFVLLAGKKNLLGCL